MKTQTWGASLTTYAFYNKIPSIIFKLCESCYSASVLAYKASRENGDSIDDPGFNFPNDGTWEWVGGDAGVANDKIYRRYNQGNGDARWMGEKDKNYLERIEREGRLKELEPAVWYLREQEHATNSIRDWWAQKLLLPDLPQTLEQAEAATATLAPAPASEKEAKQKKEKKISEEQQAPIIKFSDLQLKVKKGKGGFGVVYEGTWQYSTVAIKKLLLKKMTPEALEEFAKESAIMSNLNHPNVTRLFGICEEPGHYCMVMEYMERGSLFDFLHSQNIPWTKRYEMATDISIGLTYLHSQYIVHRDLKSPNILLDLNYRAKIADFGLSKVKLETDSTLATVCGTPRWMAPEQLKGEGSSKQSDVYSYGMILWEILTRKVPYKDAGMTAVGLIITGIKETIPADSCHVKYSDLIKRCWLERNNRPTTEEALIELQQHEGEIKGYATHI